MRWKVILSFLLVLGVAVFVWVFLRNLRLLTDPEESEGVGLRHSERDIARPNWGSEPETPDTPPVAGDADLALSGELTVLFEDKAAMERFVNNARSAGIRVLGLQDALLAVRVAAGIRDLAPFLEEGMEVGFNYPVRVPLTPSPQSYDATGLTAFDNSVLSYLGAEEAIRENWGNGVKIAVLDTGWLAHADLTGTRVYQLDLLGTARNGDYGGHGTAVSGLIASANAFAPGIAPGSELLAVRVLDASGAGNTFTVADGIVRAVDAGADVINLSLGSYGDSEILRTAVSYAESRGVVLVAASGNDGLGMLTYPAAYPSVIGVGAVDANGNLAPFSNFGEAIDVVAPGFQINTLWENDSYVVFDGTSAAAPLVTGLVARILEKAPNETPAQIRNTISNYANELGPPEWDPYFGAGVINAQRLENIGTSGIVDLAVADIYPAGEEGDGNAFPLYITVQNRGTTFIPEALLELTVDGNPYFHRFAGLDVGQVGTIQLPVREAQLEGRTLAVEATVKPGDRYMDTNTDNNSKALAVGRTSGGD
jgi:thermitase